MRIIDETPEELILLATRFKADTFIPYDDGVPRIKTLEEVRDGIAPRLKYLTQPIIINHSKKLIPPANAIIGYTATGSEFHKDHIDSLAHILKKKVGEGMLAEIRAGKWQLSDGFGCDEEVVGGGIRQYNVVPAHLALTQTPACSPDKGCGFIESQGVACESYQVKTDTGALHDTLCHLNTACYSKLLKQTELSRSKIQDLTIMEDHKDPKEKEKPAPPASGFSKEQIEMLSLAKKVEALTHESFESLLTKESNVLRAQYISALEARTVELEKKTAGIAVIEAPDGASEEKDLPKPYSIIGKPQAPPKYGGNQ